MDMMLRFLRSISILFAILALTGCYLPNKFDLTMQIAPDGRYALTYNGTLTQLQFLQRIGSGDLTGSRIDEYVGIFESDMRRDSGFKEVTYLGKAEYRVKYEKQGSLVEEKQFSFPSRKGTIVGLRHWTELTTPGYLERFRATGHPALPAMAAANFAREPHIMEIFGDRLPQKIREDLAANGYWVQGKIRIWTSAKVAYHNAQQVVEGNPSLYIWEVDDLAAQPPQMIMAWTPPGN